MIRDTIKAALTGAMKSGDTARRDTIRLIQAALKNRDIELRGADKQPEDDALVIEVLQKMIKQRRESIEMYAKGGRQELADAEAAEVAVIETFLPRQMSEAELGAAVDAIVAETGASSVRDMGRVMALVKERLGASIEPARASGLVKAALS